MADLVGNPEDQFSHNEAHLFVYTEKPRSPTRVQQHSNETYGTPVIRDGYYSDQDNLHRRNGPDNYPGVGDDPDMGILRRHHEE